MLAGLKALNALKDQIPTWEGIKKIDLAQARNQVREKITNLWKNIDLSSVKNNQFVQRACNLGWKGPVAIIGVTILTIGTYKVAKRLFSYFFQINFDLKKDFIPF